MDHFETFRYLSQNKLWDKWWKVHTIQRSLQDLKKKWLQPSHRHWGDSQVDHFETFRYLSKIIHWDKVIKGGHFSEGFARLYKKRGNDHKGVGWRSGDHLQTFRFPSQNNRWDKWWKVHTFQRGLPDFKKKKKKRGVIPKVHSHGWGTIFRLLCILPKITDGTNGESCTLFRGVCRTLNIKKG